MGNFAENLNLGNRFRPPPRIFILSAQKLYLRFIATRKECKTLLIMVMNTRAFTWRSPWQLSRRFSLLVTAKQI